MSHYDCKNCGHSGGVDFGYCKNCTPKEYFKIQNKMREIDDKINAMVDKKLEKVRCKMINDALEKSNYYNLRDELEIIKEKNC